MSRNLNYIRKVALEFAKHNTISNVDLHDQEEEFEAWFDLIGSKINPDDFIENGNILEEANEIVFKRNEEKERQYGPFAESMAKSARIASELTNKNITTEDFYKCMVALKISRMAYNSKHDTMLDSVAYIAALDDYLKKKNE